MSPTKGSGNSTDAFQHSGLREVDGLSNGTWSLDYTLQSDLINQTYDVAGWNYAETVGGACAT